MAEHDELTFWQTQRDEGRLTVAVEIYRDRAIAFFGAFAAFGKAEHELLEILEAHEVAMASDEELLQVFARASSAVAANLDTESFAPSAELVERLAGRFEQGYLSGVRASARQKLQNALGTGYNEA